MPKSPLHRRSKMKKTPVSKRMKELRGKPLTAYQKALISKFNSENVSPEDEDAFAKGFENSCKLHDAEMRLNTVVDKEQKELFQKDIRRLINEITPASRQARIDRDRKITPECLKYFRKYGKPKNIRHFINYLREKGVLARKYRAGGTIALSERATRDLLRKKFGIKGTPGRPRKPKP